MAIFTQEVCHYESVGCQFNLGVSSLAQHAWPSTVDRWREMGEVGPAVSEESNRAAVLMGAAKKKRDASKGYDLSIFTNPEVREVMRLWLIRNGIECG